MADIYDALPKAAEPTHRTLPDGRVSLRIVSTVEQTTDEHGKPALLVQSTQVVLPPGTEIGETATLRTSLGK